MVFKDKTNGKQRLMLYNNYIKIDGNGVGGLWKKEKLIMTLLIY